MTTPTTDDTGTVAEPDPTPRPDVPEASAADDETTPPAHRRSGGSTGPLRFSRSS